VSAGEKRNAYKVLVVKLKGKRHLGRHRTRWKIKLKSFKEKQTGRF
jgi:hypothetical protein